MKKLIVSLFISLFLATVAQAQPHPWGHVAAGNKLTAATSPVIAFIGDSITSQMPTTAFPGYNKVLMGQPGSNTTEILTGLGLMTWTKVPAICVYMGGTNDVRPSDPTDASITESNVGDSLALLKTKCTRVIILGIPPNELGYDDTAHQAAVESAAAAEAVQYVDLRPYFPDNTGAPYKFTSDGIHFTNTFTSYGVMNTLVLFAINNVNCTP